MKRSYNYDVYWEMEGGERAILVEYQISCSQGLAETGGYKVSMEYERLFEGENESLDLDYLMFTAYVLRKSIYVMKSIELTVKYSDGDLLNKLNKIFNLSYKVQPNGNYYVKCKKIADFIAFE
jgi:hypothetical protein